jgi:hypothetical protein
MRRVLPPLALVQGVDHARGHGRQAQIKHQQRELLAAGGGLDSDGLGGDQAGPGEIALATWWCIPMTRGAGGGGEAAKQRGFAASLRPVTQRGALAAFVT